MNTNQQRYDLDAYIETVITLLKNRSLKRSGNSRPFHSRSPVLKLAEPATGFQISTRRSLTTFLRNIDWGRNVKKRSCAAGAHAGTSPPP
ncbi:hypothetical protein EVAR_94161_1 [Eumeta japonica]|uniref:Uncharacterized protein n=1 Tax=Eumeta variegata TaxID=151549 RepID=A0A4C1U722_EUMVA|nr:hypothetical protein EVAR_94161_1 [Eumeta japonica]